jgi:AraC-like DNA-binding protein
MKALDISIYKDFCKMGLGNEILFFFSALGAFNGLILSCYFFFFIRKKQLSNYFLGLLLLALSLRVGKSVMYYFHQDISKVYLQIGLSACFFIGPALYFFIKSSLYNLKTLPNSWKIHLGILTSIMVIGGLIVPYHQYPQLWWNYIIFSIYAQWGIYLIFSGLLLKDIIKKALSDYSDLKAFDIWIFSIFMSTLLIFLSYCAVFCGVYYISGAIAFSSALYLGLFVLMYRKKTDDLFAPTNKTTTAKKLSEENTQEWSKRLDNLMLEKHLFENPNLKLNDLAQEMDISGHQLSQFLNDHLGKNFTLFVNEYRIQEACNRLVSQTNLSIEGIGFDVGFNSKSTFFAAFKKVKSMTPAQYQQNCVKA